MFGFIKKNVYCCNDVYCCNALKCISISDQECKVRPAIMNINSTEPLWVLIYTVSL